MEPDGDSWVLDTYNKGRIEALNDCIFAFAMTLLVVTIDVPPKTLGVVPSALVDQYILNVVPDFIHYMVVFALLAVFWWYQHKWSHFLHTIDTNLIVANILLLLFVALIPFTTNIVGNYPLNSHVAIIFELNMFIVGLVCVYLWAYVLKNHGCLLPAASLDKICWNLKKYSLPCTLGTGDSAGSPGPAVGNLHLQLCTALFLGHLLAGEQSQDAKDVIRGVPVPGERGRRTPRPYIFFIRQSRSCRHPQARALLSTLPASCTSGSCRRC